MNSRRCLRIAERLQTQFQAELGIAVDPQLMLSQPDYVEDVLTVCDAYPGTALSVLAQHFRVAAAEFADDTAPGALGDSQQGPQSTGFGNSAGASDARQQSHSSFERERQAARAARRSPAWMQPGRWLGHDT